jgi:hypothetical protein
VKRPAVISAISIVQALLAIVALAATMRFPVPVAFPGWSDQWIMIAALGHLGSALLLWRLHWLGPMSFIVLWVAGMVFGQFFVPRAASPGMVGTGFALVAMAIYVYIVWKDRDCFSRRNG